MAANTLPVIVTPVKNIVATVQDVGYAVAPLLLVGMLFHAHHSGINTAVIVEVCGLILILAIVVYATDIIAWIKPGSAAASTGLEAPLVLWQVFGGQVISLLSLTEGIRRVRHAGGL